jgi:hypothetical protein
MGNKDKRRLKRQRKHQEIRRRQSLSPYRQAARASGEFRCYCVQDQGIASILVMKTLSGGGRVLAGYLVDFWCCGLKDAWGRLDITAEEFEEMIDRVAGGDATVEKTDLGQVRKIVAGGIRFARQNGFKLSHRHERWAGLIGVDAAAAAEGADLDLFGIDERGKKLRYTGPITDLQRRLVGSTVEEFLARPDVEAILGTDDSFADLDLEVPEDEADEPDEADLEEALEQLRQDMQERMLQQVTQWCTANQQPPHQALPEAIDALLEAMMQAREPEGAQMDDAQFAEKSPRLFEQSLEVHGAEGFAAIKDAMNQVFLWMRSLRSRRDFYAAIGLLNENED